MARAALVFLSFALSASAAPVPKHLMTEPVLYHPTVPGAKWVYHVYGVGDERGLEINVIVIRVHEPKGLAGAKVAELGTVLRDGEVQESNSYTAVSATGLVEGHIVAGGKFVPRTEPLRASVERGTRWEVKVEDGRSGWTEKYTFRGEEKVEVPAGTFRALRVDTEVVFNDETAQRQVWHRWYAPGIGLVKSEDLEGRRRVLKEFTPAGK